MAQIINLTSEALQATIRRLLPSQQGFGEDLQATNVVTPIIDLTPTAEGSQLPTDLARSASFGAITVFANSNNTTVLANTPGFYRVQGVSTLDTTTTGSATSQFTLVSSLGTRSVWEHSSLPASAAGEETQISVPFDFSVFVDTGVTFSSVSASAQSLMTGSVWTIADRYGNIQNPSGFTFE